MVFIDAIVQPGPVMLRGTAEPDGSTILFSMLLLHLLMCTYSAATLHSHMKCLASLQKLHLDP